jgi:hypothetical protein
MGKRQDRNCTPGSGLGKGQLARNALLALNSIALVRTREYLLFFFSCQLDLKLLLSTTM